MSHPPEHIPDIDSQSPAKVKSPKEKKEKKEKLARKGSGAGSAASVSSGSSVEGEYEAEKNQKVFSHFIFHDFSAVFC
jgi:hypothetical protein